MRGGGVVGLPRTLWGCGQEGRDWGGGGKGGEVRGKGEWASGMGPQNVRQPESVLGKMGVGIILAQHIQN